jgi:phytoene dehydrogenase-like protein
MAGAKYDVVVVGAGIAGLTCANYLISSGKRVLLLEHNHQAGGLMGGFWRKGFYFDAGDQSFEQANIMFPILKELGLYQPVDWEFSDYSAVLPQGSVVFKEKKQAIEQFADLFPEQRQGIFRLFEEMERYAEPITKMGDITPNPIFSKGLNRVNGIFENLKLSRKYKKELKESLSLKLSDLADKAFPGYGLDEKFSKVGYRGMPLFLSAGFWNIWFSDYWYPRMGLQGLIDKLVDRFKGLGGEIQFKQTVEEILVKKGKAEGVSTKQGEVFEGSWTVFAGSAKRLYTEYLPPELLDSAFVDKMRDGIVSEALNAAYLGVDIPTDEIHQYLKTHHTLYMPESAYKDIDDIDDKDLHQGSFLEITCPSLHNPDLAPRGKNSLILQTFSNYKWMNNWGTKGEDFKRTPKYRQLKKMVADQMIETASAVIPNLKDRIVYQDLGSPMSTIRFTMNPEGASAGWTYDYDKSVIKGKAMTLFTPINRLLTIGHYTIWPGGVPMAALTGWAAAKAIQKEGLVEPIQRILALGKKLKR